jgi:glycosidase
MNHPLLYQINTRVVLAELGAARRGPATLDDLPDSMLDRIAADGFEWVWMLGVWQTGEVGQEISRTNPSLRDAYAHELPGFDEPDIVGSPFAIREYRAHQAFGGDKALARLRSRLAARGLKLVLDFVVNHVAPDHRWAREHPEYFIRGTEEDLAREPMNFTRLRAPDGSEILAYGRDPYFAGWPDTLQLNYQHAGCREAMTLQLLDISERCDGVRCDMAMLVQPEVFDRTWGERATPRDGSAPVKAPFWQRAIGRVKQKRPDFLLIAEVYWDMEWELQQEGFDYTYDKSLYDRLRGGYGQSVREHLWAVPEFQNHSLRFLENHDEPRAAATFPPHVHRAAAVITFLIPGLRFIHEGQFDGRMVHASMHLLRRHPEASDEQVRAFYAGLVEVLHRPETHDGEWHLWDPAPAWDGNDTWRNFVAFSWVLGNRLLLTAVNYSTHWGQCYVKIDVAALNGVEYELTDLLGEARYERRGSDMREQGLYLDMPPYGYHVFDVHARVPAAVRAR